MFIPDDSGIYAIGGLFACLVAVVVYVRLLHGQQMAVAHAAIADCEKRNADCEARGRAQQRQIDALIDGDPDAARKYRETDSVPALTEDSNGWPSEPPKRHRLRMFGFLAFALPLMVLCLMLMSGCSDEQIRQAQTISDRADALLANANTAIASAEKALLVAKQLADATNSQQASYAVQVAQGALEQAKATLPAIVAAQETAHSSLDAAKASQAAGGSTMDVLVAIAAVAVPGLGGMWAAIRRGNGWATAFQQTVEGLEKARKAMPADTWKDTVAPHLASAQDAQVKDRVNDHLAP